MLGIDYGRKRIGVAVADDAVRIATPLKTIPGRNDPTRDARALADLAETEQANSFVVGLPISMDGTDSEQTVFTRKFADELKRLSQKPVYLHDERLSSFAADEVLNEADVTKARRKELVDQIAAQKILQFYLDQP
jgi:putative holliday junction resolvase